MSPVSPHNAQCIHCHQCIDVAASAKLASETSGSKRLRERVCCRFACRRLCFMLYWEFILSFVDFDNAHWVAFHCLLICIWFHYPVVSVFLISCGFFMGKIDIFVLQLLWMDFADLPVYIYFFFLFRILLAMEIFSSCLQGCNPGEAIEEMTGFQCRSYKSLP